MNRNIDEPIKKLTLKTNKFLLVSLLTTITLVFGFLSTNINISNAINDLPINGIRCEAMESSYFHIHVHLSIFIDEQNHTVPALIGITNNCLYWLHTHDNTGIIHIESPQKKDFILGDLFDIWNKKFDNNHIFNYTVNDNNPLSIYINGTKTPTVNNYRDIVLHSHDVISIVYGEPPIQIPETYKFGSL